MSSDKKSIGKLTLLKIGGAFLSVSYSILQVQLFGATREIEVYFAAASVLYLITSLAQSGQLSELFLPIYHNQLKSFGKMEADKTFSVVINRLFVYSIIISLIAIFLAPFVVAIMVPGFSIADKTVTILIFRILAIFLVFTINSGFILTYLNANQVYGRAEMAGILSTMVSIVLLFFLFDKYRVWSLVISFVIGRVLEFLIYVVTLYKEGYRHKLIAKREQFDHLSFFKSMYSTAAYSGATQVFNVVLTASISFLPEGIYAIFKYVQQLTQKTKSIIFQPIITVFYTSFSKNAKGPINTLIVTTKKYLSLILLINTIVLIIVVSFGESILQLLWGSEKFALKDIHIAYIFLILYFIASFITQIGGVYRKMAMSFGYGKTLYLWWTLAQLLTALFSYLLISTFKVTGLFWLIPINGLLLATTSFWLIFAKENKLAFVYDSLNIKKLVAIFIITVPIGLYLNGLEGSGLVGLGRLDLLLILSIKFLILSLVILVAIYIFKITEISFFKHFIRKVKLFNY